MVKYLSIYLSMSTLRGIGEETQRMHMRSLLLPAYCAHCYSPWLGAPVLKAHRYKQHASTALHYTGKFFRHSILYAVHCTLLPTIFLNTLVFPSFPPTCFPLHFPSLFRNNPFSHFHLIFNPLHLFLIRLNPLFIHHSPLIYYLFPE